MAAVVGVVILISGGGTLIGISAQAQAIPDRGSPLAPFVGQEAGGEWKLKVVDGVGADEGTLQNWSVTAQAS